MAKTQFDGVVDAVHLMPDGALAWIRLYERRGPTFSDITRIDRAELVRRMRLGKKYVLGQRISLRASDFITAQALQLVQQDGHEYVTLEGIDTAAGDNLRGAPFL